MHDRFPVHRFRITVRGIVQGVGFRPFVYNTATAEHLSGWVVNETDAVSMEVQGSRDAIERLVHSLHQRCPPQAVIEQVNVSEIPPIAQPNQSPVFEIRMSGAAAAGRPTIPPDLATCEACQAEIADPVQRRYRYPFTNCTNCGPRWSIITGLPYDRPRTSMVSFAMCSSCCREYEEPVDRRFHAQPIACPTCGPQLRLVTADGRDVAAGDEALRLAAHGVCEGRIVALKGLGGFQLVVDATDNEAVLGLRARKQRPDKPFAIMLPDLATVRESCELSDLEARALASPQAPILLLRRRVIGKHSVKIADAVAPSNPYLGVMLPYTPLHKILMSEVARPVVCTSGNRAEEPMVIDTADALQRLGDIADLVLTHDRQIVRPVDDSVAREEDGGVQLLRRARGYAPLPIRLDRSGRRMLAVGGHLKNTVALRLGQDVVVSPHIGDLDNTLSLEMHRRTIDDLVDFFQAVPELVVCDLHPDYSSTRHAEELASTWKVPLLRIQHHCAHVLSAMAEWRLDGRVLGLSWDGTGYGVDATVWGGEAILVDGGHWERMAHLRTFALPGGDRAAREPRRSAVGLLYEMSGDKAAPLARRWFSESQVAVLFGALHRPAVFPRCSSMGRLFDAVAALCGLKDCVSFEGEAAMQLEFAADLLEVGRYPLLIRGTRPAVIDWQPMIEEILAELAAGESVVRIATRFHNSLAALCVELAQMVGCPRVVLTGGCFQNRLLSQRAKASLSAAGFDVYTQKLVPPGDGGLALGQILGAMLQLGE